MIYYQKKDLALALNRINIKKGDSVFVTSSIALLGIPKTNNKKKSITACEWLYNALLNKIGVKGNIFVPTYSYTFESNKKHIFDIKNTASKIGLFPNFFLKKKKIIRTLDPMVSVSGIGPDAKKILNGISQTSYGENCGFERMLKMNKLKCITLGLGHNWIPFIHYLDWLNKAPFRYDKFFEGFIKINKKVTPIKWHYPVRYLNRKSISDGYKLGKLAHKKKMFEEAKIGRSKIISINYKEFFDFCKTESKKNTWITGQGKNNEKN